MEPQFLLLAPHPTSQLGHPAERSSPAQCGKRTLRTRLVIGADGAHSAVREQLGIRAHTHDYGQLAIVGNVASARPHQHTAWQRFLATGPIALLPLYNGECSIVWSATVERARELMASTAWASYGAKSGNSKCADCMMHSGYEASAVDDTFSSLAGFGRTVKATLFPS